MWDGQTRAIHTDPHIHARHSARGKEESTLLECTGLSGNFTEFKNL